MQIVSVLIFGSYLSPHCIALHLIVGQVGNIFDQLVSSFTQSPSQRLQTTQQEQQEDAKSLRENNRDLK